MLTDFFSRLSLLHRTIAAASVVFIGTGWIIALSLDASAGKLSTLIIVNLIGLTLLTSILWAAFAPLRRLQAELAGLQDSPHFNSELSKGDCIEAQQIVSAFNNQLHNAKSRFQVVQRDTESITFEIQELTSLTSQLLKDTQAQTRHASSSSASIHDISTQITHIAEKADRLANMSEHTHELSNSSAQGIRETSQDIETTAQAMTDLSKTIGGLSQSTEYIANIAGVIRSIAEQTNLLALNAAIEAARAGDQGRGFAVVADEVRSLAARTAQATQEISQLISSVTSQTERAVTSMEHTREQVLAGASKASSARTQMLEICQGIGNVVQTVREIATLTDSQRDASNVIANSAEQLDAMSQVNATALVQSQQGLERLVQRTHDLAQLTDTMALSDIEVIHGWTASSDVHCLNAIKTKLNQLGHHWGDRAKVANIIDHVNERIRRGNLPTAAAVAGVKIQNWANANVLANLNDLAQSEQWDKLLPPELARMSKVKGVHCAAILGVTRVNALWVNIELMKRVGCTSAPTSWDQFFAVCDALLEKGITPIAHSEEAWQIATFFEAIALGVGGANWYQRAFCNQEAQALRGNEMIASFEMLARLKRYCPADAIARDWSLVTADIISGRAAMQLMGDWVKGALDMAEQESNKDYWFWPAPQGEFVYAADTLVMFHQEDAHRHRAQQDFARLLMSSEGQYIYSKHKGCIPARNDVNVNQLGDYARSSQQDFIAAANSNKLVPSWVHNMALQDQQKQAAITAVDAFWKGSLSAAEGAYRLATALGK